MICYTMQRISLFSSKKLRLLYAPGGSCSSHLRIQCHSKQLQHSRFVHQLLGSRPWMQNWFVKRADAMYSTTPASLQTFHDTVELFVKHCKTPESVPNTWDNLLKQMLDEFEVDGTFKKQHLCSVLDTFSNREWISLLRNVNGAFSVKSTLPSRSVKASNKLFVEALATTLESHLVHSTTRSYSLNTFKDIVECINALNLAYLQQTLLNVVGRVFNLKAHDFVAAKSLFSTFFSLYPNISESNFRLIVWILTHRMEALATDDFILIPQFLSRYYINNKLLIDILVENATVSPSTRFSNDPEYLLLFLSSLATFKATSYKDSSILMQLIKSFHYKLAEYNLEDVLVVSKSFSQLNSRKSLHLPAFNQYLHDLESRTFTLLKAAENNEVPTDTLVDLMTVFNTFSIGTFSANHATDHSYPRTEGALLLYLLSRLAIRLDIELLENNWKLLNNVIKGLDSFILESHYIKQLLHIAEQALENTIARHELVVGRLTAPPLPFSMFSDLVQTCKFLSPKTLSLFFPLLERCVPSLTVLELICSALEKPQYTKLEERKLTDLQSWSLQTATEKAAFAVAIQHWWEILRSYFTFQIVVIRASNTDIKEYFAVAPYHIRMIKTLDSVSMVTTKCICEFYTSFTACMHLASLAWRWSSNEKFDHRILTLLSHSRHLQQMSRELVLTLGRSPWNTQELCKIFDNSITAEIEGEDLPISNQSRKSEKKATSATRKSSATLLPLPVLASYFLLRINEAIWHPESHNSIVPLHHVAKCLTLRMTKLSATIRDSSISAADARFAKNGLGKYGYSPAYNATFFEKAARIIDANFLRMGSNNSLYDILNLLIVMHRDFLNAETKLKEEQLHLMESRKNLNLYQENLSLLKKVSLEALNAYFSLLLFMPSTFSRGFSQTFIDICVLRALEKKRNGSESENFSGNYEDSGDSNVKLSIIRKLQLIKGR